MWWCHNQRVSWILHITFCIVAFKCIKATGTEPPISNEPRLDDKVVLLHNQDEQTIHAAVLTFIVTIAASLPLQICNKLKMWRKELISMTCIWSSSKTLTTTWMSILSLTLLAKTNQHWSNVHLMYIYSEPLIGSQLELSAITAGILYGTLSPHALNLVSHAYIH